MIRPKKHLGQHFLRDENIARKIIRSLSGKYPNIIEIGAGTGILSKYLLQDKNLNPFFFEIDEESIHFLIKKFPEISDKLIFSDFLEYDLSALPAPFAVLGNFPYNISSQILFRILEFRNSIPEVTGMFQKEVADRIVSKPGSRKYGILSVLLQAFYDIRLLFTVNETVFFPPPRVKSAVIQMRRNNITRLDCDECFFFKVVKTAFNQRRKILRNALARMDYQDQAGLDDLLSKRAEQLSVQDFILLSASISPSRSSSFQGNSE